jgi:hypothetical protein
MAGWKAPFGEMIQVQKKQNRERLPGETPLIRDRGCQPIPGSSRERVHNGQTKTPNREWRIDTQWHPLIICSGFSQKIIIHEKNYGQWPF